MAAGDRADLFRVGVTGRAPTMPQKKSKHVRRKKGVEVKRRGRGQKPKAPPKSVATRARPEKPAARRGPAPRPKRRAKPARTKKPPTKTTPPPRPSIESLTPEERAQAAYDGEVLAVLRDEFPSDDRAAYDAKIRERLRRKALGPFDAERVATLRRLKDALQAELSSGPTSGHFTEPHGLYANPDDFDHDELVRAYSEAYSSVSPLAIAAFVPLAVYLYYLR